MESVTRPALDELGGDMDIILSLRGDYGGNAEDARGTPGRETRPTMSEYTFLRIAESLVSDLVIPQLSGP